MIILKWQVQLAGAWSLRSPQQGGGRGGGGALRETIQGVTDKYLTNTFCLLSIGGASGRGEPAPSLPSTTEARESYSMSNYRVAPTQASTLG